MQEYTLIMKINDLQKQVLELEREIRRLRKEISVPQPAYPVYPYYPCPTYPWRMNEIW